MSMNAVKKYKRINNIDRCYFCDCYPDSPHHIIPQHIFKIYQETWKLRFNKDSPENIKWLCKECHTKLEKLLPYLYHKPSKDYKFKNHGVV